MGIYAAIVGVMGDISPIAKGRKNAQQGFMYRGIDDIMNELQSILVKHKVFIVPEVLEVTRAEKLSKSGGALFYSILKTKFTFYSDDGSSVSAVIVGEGMDSADKASNKALSVAFKYACLQVFCIPTEDTKDPDAESPQVAAPQAPSEFSTLEHSLTEYLDGGWFNHPEIVKKAIDGKDIKVMREALAAAKVREADAVAKKE